MGETTAKVIRNSLEMIVDAYGGVPDDGSSKVEFWEMIAEKLSRIVMKEPAWTWRYPLGVFTGTTEPSKRFSSAVMALGTALDDMPTALIYTVQVKVFARPGTVLDNSVILGESKSCARRGCPVQIVPNVPWRKYCSDDCAKAAEQERKAAQNGHK